MKVGMVQSRSNWKSRTRNKVVSALLRILLSLYELNTKRDLIRSMVMISFWRCWAVVMSESSAMMLLVSFIRSESMEKPSDITN